MVAGEITGKIRAFLDVKWGKGVKKLENVSMGGDVGPVVGGKGVRGFTPCFVCVTSAPVCAY